MRDFRNGIGEARFYGQVVRSGRAGEIRITPHWVVLFGISAVISGRLGQLLGTIRTSRAVRVIICLGVDWKSRTSLVRDFHSVPAFTLNYFQC